MPGFYSLVALTLAVGSCIAQQKSPRSFQLHQNQGWSGSGGPSRHEPLEHASPQRRATGANVVVIMTDDQGLKDISVLSFPTDLE